MKPAGYVPVIVLYLIASVAGGCAGKAAEHDRQSLEAPRIAGRALTFRENRIVRFKWDNGVAVLFTSDVGEWIMDVTDYGQSGSGGATATWSTETSKCSLEELLYIVDQSLARFRKMEPEAEVGYVRVALQVDRELWSDMLNRLGRTMEAMDGEVAAFTPRSELYDEAQRVVRQSPVTAAIKALLAKRGLRSDDWIVSEPAFKDSVAGLKWRDVACLPGLGISSPGTVDLGLPTREDVR